MTYSYVLSTKCMHPFFIGASTPGETRYVDFITVSTVADDKFFFRRTLE